MRLVYAPGMNPTDIALIGRMLLALYGHRAPAVAARRADRTITGNRADLSPACWRAVQAWLAERQRDGGRKVEGGTGP
jgi:hypothetical protein